MIKQIPPQILTILIILGSLFIFFKRINNVSGDFRLSQKVGNTINNTDIKITVAPTINFILHSPLSQVLFSQYLHFLQTALFLYGQKYWDRSSDNSMQYTAIFRLQNKFYSFHLRNSLSPSVLILPLLES